MNYILVNASAAVTGGAETIINAFVDSLDLYSNDRDIKFVVISQLTFNVSNKERFIFIKKSTNGLRTLWFTTVGILRYQIKYRTNKVLSFNNINSVYTGYQGINYFHQLKLIDNSPTELKLLLYSTVIRFFNHRNTFIVQSEFVKDLFQKKYKKNAAKIVVSWPGFVKPDYLKVSNINDHKITGLIPYSYDAPHKNLDLALQLAIFFSSEDVEVFTLLDFSKADNFVDLGNKSKVELFKMYETCDFLLFTSLSETVGLPIFEFLQTGKPAFVYAADYAVAFYEQFNKPINFILFRDAADFERLFLQNINVRAPFYDYSKGEWDKIIDLL